MTGIDAHLYSDPGDRKVVKGHSRTSQKETHRSWPTSVTSFNAGEDMEGERESPLTPQHRAASSYRLLFRRAPDMPNVCAARPRNDHLDIIHQVSW